MVLAKGTQRPAGGGVNPGNELYGIRMPNTSKHGGVQQAFKDTQFNTQTILTESTSLDQSVHYSINSKSDKR